MKTWKKISVLVLAVMMLLGLAACQKADEKETLVMATNAAFPPYEYYEDGKIVGIDAEVAQAIADKLGMELVIEDMEFGAILSAVQSGKADIGLAGMTVTDERKLTVDFTPFYAQGKQVIIVKAEGSTVASADDLADKAIGVQENTTGDIFCSGDYPDADIQRYSKGVDAVQALVQGKVDCVVIDSEPAQVFVSQNEGLTILETPYIVEDYAGALCKDNAELNAKIIEALNELLADGTIDTIVAKYISAE